MPSFTIDFLLIAPETIFASFFVYECCRAFREFSRPDDYDIQMAEEPDPHMSRGGRSLPTPTTFLTIRSANVNPLTAATTSTSADCAELAENPTRDPTAYAIAFALEFGTQVPPYTHRIGDDGRPTITDTGLSTTASPESSSPTTMTRSKFVTSVRSRDTTQAGTTTGAHTQGSGDQSYDGIVGMDIAIGAPIIIVFLLAIFLFFWFSGRRLRSIQAHGGKASEEDRNRFGLGIFDNGEHLRSSMSGSLVTAFTREGRKPKRTGRDGDDGAQRVDLADPTRSPRQRKHQSQEQHYAIANPDPSGREKSYYSDMKGDGLDRSSGQ